MVKKLLPVLLVILVLALWTRPGRVALKTTGIAFEVFPNSPVYPMRTFTRSPTVVRTKFPVGSASWDAWVYRPAGHGRFGALVFYIGIGPEHQNPHVVRLSRALARAGVVVMVPVSPNLSAFRVRPGEEEGAVAAFEWLRERPYVDPDRVGFFGISVGGSMTAIAASDPRISRDVRLIDLFGAYYDARTLLAALVTHRIEVGGRWREWQPSPVPLQVLRTELLSYLSEGDRRAIQPLLDGKVRTVPPGLSPEGRATALMLLERDPSRMPNRIAALPPAMRDYLRRISPSTYVGGLRAELFLMHDRRDNIIPWTETLEFWEAAHPARGKHLTILDIFRHVEPQGGNPLRLVWEGGKLWWHIYRVIYILG